MTPHLPSGAMRTAQTERKEERRALHAERIRRARAEPKAECKAIDAEPKDRAWADEFLTEIRAEEHEDRKLPDAERKRKDAERKRRARVKRAESGLPPYKRPPLSAAARVADALRKRKSRAQLTIEFESSLELVAKRLNRDEKTTPPVRSIVASVEVICGEKKLIPRTRLSSKTTIHGTPSLLRKAVDIDVLSRTIGLVAHAKKMR